MMCMQLYLISYCSKILISQTLLTSKTYFFKFFGRKLGRKIIEFIHWFLVLLLVRFICCLFRRFGFKLWLINSSFSFDTCTLFIHFVERIKKHWCKPMIRRAHKKWWQMLLVHAKEHEIRGLELKFLSVHNDVHVNFQSH